MQHFYALRQEALCEMYAGDPRDTFERLDETWPALRRSNMLRVPLIRIDALAIRGRLTLATIEIDPDRFLRRVDADARRLQREGRSDARVLGFLLAGGAASVRRK
jgi:hypothetical protein